MTGYWISRGITHYETPCKLGGQPPVRPKSVKGKKPMIQERNVFRAVVHTPDGTRWLVDTDGQAFYVANTDGQVEPEPRYVRGLTGKWDVIEAWRGRAESDRIHDARVKAFERKFQALYRAWQPHINN